MPQRGGWTEKRGEEWLDAQTAMAASHAMYLKSTSSTLKLKMDHANLGLKTQDSFTGALQPSW